VKNKPVKHIPDNTVYRTKDGIRVRLSTPEAIGRVPARGLNEVLVYRIKDGYRFYVRFEDLISE